MQRYYWWTGTTIEGCGGGITL